MKALGSLALVIAIIGFAFAAVLEDELAAAFCLGMSLATQAGSLLMFASSKLMRPANMGGKMSRHGMVDTAENGDAANPRDVPTAGKQSNPGAQA